MPSSKPTVNLVVSEETKGEWEQAVEDGRFASLSELVRTSVYRELEGYHAPDAMGGTVESGEREASEEVLTRLSHIEDTLSSVNDTVNRVEQQTSSQGPEYNLQRVLISLIDEPHDGPTVGLTAEDLAVKTDLPVSRVEDALEGVLESAPYIQQSDVSGEERYYRATGHPEA